MREAAQPGTALLILAAAALLAQACRHSRPDHLGRYVLVSVDGAKVPGEVTHGEATIHVTSGVFVIAPDMTCRSTTVFVAPDGRRVVREVTATYTRAGAELTMQWEGAGRTVGSVDEDVFTMDNHGMIFRYERRDEPAGTD